MDYLCPLSKFLLLLKFQRKIFGPKILRPLLCIMTFLTRTSVLSRNKNKSRSYCINIVTLLTRTSVLSRNKNKSRNYSARREIKFRDEVLLPKFTRPEITFHRLISSKNLVRAFRMFIFRMFIIESGHTISFTATVIVTVQNTLSKSLTQTSIQVVFVRSVLKND